MTPEERRAYTKRVAVDQELCRLCGYRRINVRHEPDPDTAPEGKAYYDEMRDQLHEFVRSGQYEWAVR